jgi:hypothetical protein
LGNIYKLATGQIGFMSIFALPLFEGVSDILPDLKFTVHQIVRAKINLQGLPVLLHVGEEVPFGLIAADVLDRSGVAPHSESHPEFEGPPRAASHQ